MGIRYSRYLAAIVASFAIHATASAASFDCAQAKTPREQLICGNTDLSSLDEQLGRVYRERRALLSPRGAELLKESQRSWLHYIGIVCPPEMPKNSVGNSKSCLQNEYANRLKQLGMVGQKAGPFVFNRIDTFDARAAHADPLIFLNFYTRHVAYPQIDNPRSSQAEDWNRQHVKGWPPTDCDDGRNDQDYEVGLANEKMISVEWRISQYCGGAHGMGWFKTDNVILEPSPHAVTQSDVFSTDNWTTKLQTLFWDALREQGWKPPDFIADNVKTEMQASFVKPDRWFFDTEGLKISFGAYEGGCYACTPQPATVSWADLKPFLSPTSPVP